MTKTSTKPKGATSYKETAFGIIPRSKLLKLELEGTKKGLVFISKTYNTEITPAHILDIHRESFGWIFPSWAGKFRTIRVEFSGKEAVLPHQISELIVNLCADLSERFKHLDPQDDNFVNQVVELLAWFQHRFVWIHDISQLENLIGNALSESLGKIASETATTRIRDKT